MLRLRHHYSFKQSAGFHFLLYCASIDANISEPSDTKMSWEFQEAKFTVERMHVISLSLSLSLFSFFFFFFCKEHLLDPPNIRIFFLGISSPVHSIDASLYNGLGIIGGTLAHHTFDSMCIHIPYVFKHL
uniref:Uncharacterized protein n=1 Tax=Oryza nivara TaxID=4536 RepID=A0A0E0ICV0_ORYNI